MQLTYFSNGGYVIHKAFNDHTSAWYDGNGKLCDAEYTDKAGHQRYIKADSTRWNDLLHFEGKENFQDWHAEHCRQNDNI